jgi:hypothetical protein
MYRGDAQIKITNLFKESMNGYKKDRGVSMLHPCSTGNQLSRR